MKPTIRLKVVDWFSGNAGENYFTRFLAKRYNIAYSWDPDYILCSIFGNAHRDYDCIKIVFLGENMVPDFNAYDYALSFQDITFDDRYLRFPLPLLYDSLMELAQKKHLLSNEDALLKRDFCSFVVSNKNARFRKDFFEALSKHRFVASGGRFKNNIGDIGSSVACKLNFIKNYKFNLACENASSPYYSTEKLFQAFAAQTIPIYWGDPRIKDWVNPKAMINLSDFSSFQEAIDYILYVDSNPSVYLEMLHQKVFLQEDIQGFYEKKLDAFFANIFSQEINQAKRRQERIIIDLNSYGGEWRWIAFLNSLLFWAVFKPLKPLYKKAKRFLRR